MPLSRIFLAAGFLFMLSGCGKKESKVVPASGMVRINGNPAGNIAVRFMPDSQKGNSGPSSSGISNDKGEFVLKCDDGRDGAVPGWHRVILDDLDADRPAQGQPAKSKPRLDDRFAIATQSLEIEVKEGVALEIPASGPR